MGQNEEPLVFKRLGISTAEAVYYEKEKHTK